MTTKEINDLLEGNANSALHGRDIAELDYHGNISEDSIVDIYEKVSIEGRRLA